VHRTYLAIFVLFFLLIGVQSPFPRGPLQNQTLPSLNLESSASLDPDFPESLTNESAVYDWYGSVGDYYYKTAGNASAGYHVFWVYPADEPPDQFDLFLHMDAEYSFYVANTIIYGWLLTRLAVPQPLYIQFHTYSTAGNAYLEWEDGSARLAVNTPVSGFLGGAERIELYQVALSKDKSYTFNLSVPASGDFDLYIYYLDKGASTGGLATIRSKEGGAGIDEVIQRWTSPETDEYAVLVIRQSGSGTYNLTLSTSTEGGDSFVIYLIVGGVIIGLAGTIIGFLWLRPHRGRNLSIKKKGMKITVD
jgi:hypothetical protein